MDIRATLIAAGEHLAPAMAEAIVNLGQAAVPELAAVLNDPELGPENAPGEGWAPIHAVRLLGRIGGAEAAAALVAFLPSAEPMEILYSAVLRALGGIGAPIVEPLLALAETAPSEDTLDAALEALVDTHVRDPRILGHLLVGLKRRPGLYAGHLAEYGDPAALPALRAAFALVPAPEAEDDSLLAGHDIIEFAEAIEELGGTLGLVGEQKLAAVQAKRAVYREALARTIGLKKGRRRR